MVEKITTYKFTCDLCGATIQNEGSLPDGWKSGYNRDVQICSKCGKHVFIDEVDEAIHTIRDFCRSHVCTVNCPLSYKSGSGEESSCKLRHRPTGSNWTSTITKLNEDKGKYSDILKAINVLRVHCCGRQCYECRLRRVDAGVKDCLFETCNPIKWEVSNDC